MLWCPQFAGVNGWTVWKRGDDVVDVVLAAQLEQEVAVDEEDGDDSQDCCEADHSKQNKEAFSSEENLPGYFL